MGSYLHVFKVSIQVPPLLGGLHGLPLQNPQHCNLPENSRYSLSPGDGASHAMSRNLDFVSRVVGVEMCYILEESLWLSYGENNGWGQGWGQDDSWELITLVWERIDAALGLHSPV